MPQNTQEDLTPDAVVRTVPVGWIPTSERMPEPGTECIVWSPGNVQHGPFAFIDTWREQRECPVDFSTVSVPIGLGWDSSDFDEITHWMPRPPAPGSADTEGRPTDHPLRIAGASGALGDPEIQRIAGSDELTGDAILRFARRLLADRAEEIAELRRQLDERGGVVELQRLRIAELERLYTTVNDLMTYMGYHGEAFAGGDRARAVMDALHAIDGGEIQSHPMGGAILRGEAASDFLKTIGALPRPSLSMHPADKLEMDRAFNEVADGVALPAETKENKHG